LAASPPRLFAARRAQDGRCRIKQEPKSKQRVGACRRETGRFEKTLLVIEVTERVPHSAMLGWSVWRASVVKKIFVVMVLAFAFTTGMAVTTIIVQIVS
jgi:hypothetical protein